MSYVAIYRCNCCGTTAEAPINQEELGGFPESTHPTDWWYALLGDRTKRGGSYKDRKDICPKCMQTYFRYP